MYSFEKFKQALRIREEEKFQALKKEVRELRCKIEKALEMFFESSTGRAQTNYTGLQMY